MSTAGELSLPVDRRDRLFSLLSGAEARDLKEEHLDLLVQRETDLSQSDISNFDISGKKIS